MENFKIATQQKLRFATVKGQLTTEQLWDLTLEQLDELAVQLQKEYEGSKGKSFLVKRTSKDKTAKLRFDIVLDILQTKVEELNGEKQAAEDRRHNEKIESLIAMKQDEELAGKTVAELKKMLK